MQFGPILDAQKLARKNRATWERVNGKVQELTETGGSVQGVIDLALTRAFDDFLGPFATLFARLKNVALDELPTVAAVPELMGLDIELKATGLKALGALSSTLGGGVAGIAAGGASLAGVAAFSTASTGTAISTLSGAAASSATLAWLGGGSLAAGGGGMAAGTLVLGGIIAAPVAIAFLSYIHIKGKKSYREQMEIKAQLDESEWDVDIQTAKVAHAAKHVDNTATVLNTLTHVGVEQLQSLADLLDRSEDYAAYTPAERSLVAGQAGLATTIAAVIACPLLDQDGRVTALSHDSLKAATLLANRLAA